MFVIRLVHLVLQSVGTEWDRGGWRSCNAFDEKSHKRTREVCFLEFLHREQLPQNSAVREVNQKSSSCTAEL